MRILIAVLISLASACPASAGMSLDLEQAIEMSLEHSYGVKSSLHDSIAASHDYKAARSLRFPTLSLDASSYYIDEIPSVEFPFMGERQLGVRDNYQADFRLSLPLFTGGRISNRIKMSRENVQAKSLALAARQLNTAYNCRKAYLGLMLARAIASSAEASLERIKIIRQDVSNLHASGLADSVDILEAELAYQKGLQMLAEKQTLERNAAISLNRVLGLPEDMEISPTEEIPAPPSSDTQAWKSPERINRPELSVLDNRVRTAEYLSRLNKADYFPSLSGFVGYSVGKPNKDFFDNEWNDNYIAGATLNWQFNLGGKTHHGVRSAGQAAFSARMSRKQLEESLTIAAAVALENLKLAYHTFTISRKENEIAEAKYRLGQNKQKQGYLTVNRLLEMEAELTASEQLYRASMISYYISEAEYFYAVGADKIYGGL